MHFLSSYGYVTNTKIKFVIVVESSNTTLRDNEIRSVSFFKKMIFYSMYTVHIVKTDCVYLFFITFINNIPSICFKKMFRKLHSAYVDMVCNPFYEPGQTINSKLVKQNFLTFSKP